MRSKMEIGIQLMGIPKVSFLEKTLHFSLKKTEALLYILAVKKECTREFVIELLWEDLSEEDARHNLRNSLYQLKKIFGGNSPILASKSILRWNPEYFARIDMEVLIDPKGKISAHSFSEEFMKGFYLNQSEGFNSWVDLERHNLNCVFIRRVYSEIDRNIEQKRWEEVILLCQQIIEKDLYDERAYRILMEAYSVQGSVNKVIETYGQLVKVLEEELGTIPDRETESLYESIILKNKAKTERVKNEEVPFFYGRKIELKYLYSLFNEVERGKNEAVWIYGEAGVGKSYLCSEFSGQLPAEQVYLLKTECYKEASGYYLKPWQKIAEKLAELSKKEGIDLNINSIENLAEFFPEFRALAGQKNRLKKNDAQTKVIRNIEIDLLEIFQKLSDRKRIVIIFEDIQWIDNDSFTILRGVMEKISGVLLLVTSRSIEEQKIEQLYGLLCETVTGNKVEIECFSECETIDFSRLVLGETVLKRFEEKRVYSETQGNPFFIDQLLKNIQENGSDRIELAKIQDLLKKRFLRVTNEERKILDIISVFYDEAEFETLKELLRKDEIEMLYIIENLKSQQIIIERLVENKVYLRFTHVKLREFIYEEQPMWKKRILHKKIGNLIEAKWMGASINPEVCNQLIYHYYMAGEKYKELRFSLLYLMFLMEIKIELTYVDMDFGGSVLQKSEQSERKKRNVHSLFEEWEKRLVELRLESEHHKDLYQIEVMYKYLLGRYYITLGNYTKGVRLTKQMLEQATKEADKEYIVKGYKLLLFQGIQIHDVAMVDLYSKAGLSLMTEKDNLKEYSLFLRYRGITYQMRGLHDEARSYMNQSSEGLIRLCETDRQSVMELAMNYYYLGEMKRKDQFFSEAMKLYEKAVEICRKNGYGEGLERFKTKAGQAAMGMGDFEYARKLFQESIELYEIKGTYWARTIAEGYLAWLTCEKGQCAKAVNHIKQAEKYCKRIKNPYEEGILLMVKAKIRRAMDGDPKISKCFSEILNEEPEYYAKEAKLRFEKTGGCYEEQLLTRG